MRVPIVAAAVLFDLAVGDPDAYPDAGMGESACASAGEGEISTGAVGAGTGATAGKLLGVARSSGGGLGVSRLDLPGGGVVAALAAVNSFGDVVDPDSGEILASPTDANGRAIRSMESLVTTGDDALREPLAPGANTTLVCVATTIPFDTGSLKRVAIEAHDGIARAVRPAHTVVDGDVAFALAPGGPVPPLRLRLRVGAAAAEAVARAIVDAVRSPSA